MSLLSLLLSKPVRLKDSPVASPPFTRWRALRTPRVVSQSPPGGIARRGSASEAVPLDMDRSGMSIAAGAEGGAPHSSGGGRAAKESPRPALRGAAAAALAEASARQRAEEGRLRLPEFSWYLDPMYKRYADILGERARANTAQVVKKKVIYTAPPEPPWMKHTKPKHVTYTFGDGVYERPLDNHHRAHITAGQSPRSPHGGSSHRSAGSASQTPRLKDGGQPGHTPRIREGAAGHGATPRKTGDVGAPR